MELIRNQSIKALDEVSRTCCMALIAVVVLSAFSSAQAKENQPADASIPGYILKQRHEIIGDTTAMITRNGIKLIVGRSGETLLCVGPQWRACLYSTKSQRLYAKTLDQFSCPFTKALYTLGGTFMYTIPIMPSSTTTDHNLKLSCYKARPGFAELQVKRQKNEEIKPSSARDIDYAVVTDPSIVLEPQVGNAMAKVLGLPTKSAIPYWFDYTDCRSGHHTYVQKREFRKAKFKASEFVLPAGLTETADPEKVLAGSEEDETVEMMMMGSEGRNKRGEKKP